jgi:serine protease AprX
MKNIFFAKISYILFLFNAFVFIFNQNTYAQVKLNPESKTEKTTEKTTEIKPQNKYFVQFKDKENNGFSLDKPEKFLSQKSIQRRKNQNIALDWRDLPVNNTYLKELSKNGAKVWYASKWFNGAMIEISKENLEKIKKLVFIKENSITYLAPATSHKSFNENSQEKIKNTFQFQPAQNPIFEPLLIENKEDYGKSFNQSNMIGADKMHQKGFRGKNITIAVFDAGFANGNKVPFLKHLHENKQILGTFDFVTHQPNVYRTGEHGLQVLSTIASYQKGKIIGTAPEASFYLFRTEDANTEYKSEEINWVVGAEQADSLGVDVINSSLGYNDFDDSKMDYTYKDMNGKVSFASQSATWAVRRGIVVCNSAGNEGDDSWRYVGSPADADSIVAVGATNVIGEKASFSSFGPTFDKRIKPLVSAQGSPAITGNPSGNITNNSGTSFSSPIIAGFIASVWSAYPKLTAWELIEIIKNSGDQALKPDNKLGYGIPHFDRIEKLVEKKKN